MSSLEITELTGKLHGHVMRDIRTMLEAIGGQSSFGSAYLDAQGKERACYLRPFDETMTLVAGYDAALRFKIVKRWRELEAQQTPRIPTHAEALRLAADAIERTDKELGSRSSIRARA